MFCEQSLINRRKDAADGKAAIVSDLAWAIAHAERADMDGMKTHLDQAQARITSLRNDLADLAMERERQMDAEDQLCGR